MTPAHKELTLATVLAGRDVLVLSPHLDDAILSAATIVLDRPCEVWTVWAGRPVPPQRTAWDELCGFTDSDETMGTRQREDEAAFAGTPATVRRLGLLDGPYIDPAGQRAAVPALIDEIDAWMTSHPHSTVVAPVGAGAHMPPPPWEPLVPFTRRGLAVARSAARTLRRLCPAKGAEDAGMSTPSRRRLDQGHPVTRSPLINGFVGRSAKAARRALHAEYRHRRRKAQKQGMASNPEHVLLRDLTLRLAAKHPDVQVLLFEDLPYLWHARGDDAARRVEKAHRLRLAKFSAEVDIHLKHAHLSHYTSQLLLLDPAGRLLRPESLPDREVFWLTCSR